MKFQKCSSSHEHRTMEGSYEKQNEDLGKKQCVGDGESTKGEKNSWVQMDFHY